MRSVRPGVTLAAVLVLLTVGVTGASASDPGPNEMAQPRAQAAVGPPPHSLVSGSTVAVKVWRLVGGVEQPIDHAFNLVVSC